MPVSLPEGEVGVSVSFCTISYIDAPAVLLVHVGLAQARPNNQSILQESSFRIWLRDENH